jgi:glycosyltransferase involved in cell wall biosynthesis
VVRVTGLRVAIVSPTVEGGGVTSYLRRQATEFEAVGHDVDVIDGVDPSTSNPFAFGALVDRIPDEADVVHVHFEAGLFGRLGVSGVGAPHFFRRIGRLDDPVVTTLHEVHDAHEHRGTLGDVALRWRDWALERAAVRASDAVVVPTKAAEATLRRRHGDRSIVARRPHPVEADVERVAPDAAKSAFDVSGDVLLTFGWVEEKKEYADVVEALPDLPSATYLIAGGKRPGEGEAVLESTLDLARELGVRDRVRYLGYVDEDRIDTLVSAADAVVLPYDRVSQSGAVNDALAHRRPVVAAALPFFEELREEFGCLLSYDDRAELVEALRAALDDDATRERLAAGADSYVAEHSWSRFAEWTEALYARVGVAGAGSSPDYREDRA